MAIIRRHQCAVCAGLFGKRCDLARHLRTHSPGRFICAICGKAFVTECNLKTHMLRHTRTKPFGCSSCAKRFYTNVDLREHASAHSGKKLFVCEICGKTLANRGSLHIHKRLHIGDLRYPCKECPAKFVDKNTRDRHFKVHVGRREFACSHCSASFRGASILGKHIHVHDSQQNLPFKCGFCQIEFDSSLALRNHHEFVHETSETAPKSRKKNSFPVTSTCGQERTFSCQQCLAKFCSVAVLKSHSRVHLDEAAKPLRCAVCGARFKRVQDLTKHILTHQNQQYGCAWCGNVVTTKESLVKHIRGQHQRWKPLACEYCTARFADLSSLRVHRRIHTGEKPFACEHCPARYAQKCNLRTHMRTHTRPKPFMCDACDECFASATKLRSHKLVHGAENGAVRFGCAICQSYFGSKYGVADHLQSSRHNDAFPFAIFEYVNDLGQR